MKHALLLLALLATQARAQNQANTWYFGANAGIRFGGGNVTALTDGALSTLEGCSTVSSSTGDLLFYTDGVTVYDANHSVMPNGTGLLGDASSTQSAMIIKQPGSCERYFIFTIDDGLLLPPTFDGFRYTVVDMSLNGGLGDVVVAEKNILIRALARERMTAVKHANGTDYWIVIDDWTDNDIYSYLFTATGVSMVPVDSQVGPIHVPQQQFIPGQLKSSYQGDQLAIADALTSRFRLFAYNDATGIASNQIIIQSTTDPIVGITYGAEFSPDGDLLYGTVIEGAPALLQFDLSLPDGESIASQRTVLATHTVNSLTVVYHGVTYNNIAAYYGALQTGPDSMIYCAKFGDQSLGRIAQPNQLGSSCGYTNDAVPLDGQTCYYGLPTVATSYILPEAPDTTNVSICADASYELPDGSIVDSAGLYTFTVFDPLTCDSIDSVINLEVTPLLELALGNDTSICADQEITLNATVPDATYLWNTGATSATFSTSAAGTYSVTVSLNGCSASDTITVGSLAVAEIELGNDTIICAGEPLVLDASYPGATYLWQDGSTSPTIIAADGGTFSVEATLGGCITTDQMTVEITPLPTVDLGNDTSICAGQALLLDATYPGATYLWQDGSTTPTLNAATGGLYTVVVNPNGCTATDSVTLAVHPLPSVNLGNDTSLCVGQTIVLDATYPGASYLWNDGTTGANLVTGITGTYSVVVDLNGCTATDAVAIEVIDLSDVELGDDQRLCPGESATLAAQSVSASYLWNTGASTSTINVNAAGTYAVLVQNGTCSVADTVVVTYVTLPQPSLGNDRAACEGDTIPLSVEPGDASVLWSTGSNYPNLAATGSDTYVVLLSLEGCTATDTIQLDFLPTELEVDLGADTLLCPGEILILDATTEDATYQWSTRSIDAIETVSEPGTYWVTVTTACAEATDMIVIETGSCANVPNSFTPNGDGINDAFRVVIAGTQPREFEFTIFDRWGRVIFSSGTPDSSWDGEGTPIGVYPWKLRYRDLEVGGKEYFGHVTLLR